MTHQDILNKISVFCERPVDNSTELKQPLWDFYHSFFFAFTVVSTIGKLNFKIIMHLIKKKKKII